MNENFRRGMMSIIEWISKRARLKSFTAKRNGNIESYEVKLKKQLPSFLTEIAPISKEAYDKINIEKHQKFGKIFTISTTKLHKNDNLPEIPCSKTIDKLFNSLKKKILKTKSRSNYECHINTKPTHPLGRNRQNKNRQKR